MNMLRTTGRATLAAVAALSLLAACGGDDGGSSDVDTAVDKAVEEAAAEGVSLDRDCVKDIAEKLSDEDIAKIAESEDGEDVELSPEGEALSIEILGCVPKDELVDQMMTSLAGTEGVDEECLRGVFDEMTTEELQAMAASGGDSSSEAFNEMMTKVMPCITLGS